VVRAGELDPDRAPVRPRVRVGGVGAERLGEHGRRAAVQQAERLHVPGDRHGADGALGGHLLDLDAHALHQGARRDVGAQRRGRAVGGRRGGGGRQVGVSHAR